MEILRTVVTFVLGVASIGFASLHLAGLYHLAVSPPARGPYLAAEYAAPVTGICLGMALSLWCFRRREAA